jgi:hypothetical protein
LKTASTAPGSPVEGTFRAYRWTPCGRWNLATSLATPATKKPPRKAALATWREHRPDFAAGVKPWDFVIVDAFYSNLERTVALFQPRQPATDGAEFLTPPKNEVGTK